ncbi:hypothetical protein KIPB_012212, partial [Kipferlia bialata]
LLLASDSASLALTFFTSQLLPLCPAFEAMTLQGSCLCYFLTPSGPM